MIPADDPRVCIHVTVTGKVQGVLFRNSTAQKARTLKLTGWVRNLSTGEVEVAACGNQDSITELVRWLGKGPPLASVKQLRWEKIEPENYPDFEVQ